MVLDQTTLVLLVTNNDLFQAFGVSYIYMCEGIRVMESSPSTPTSHVLMRASFGLPDIARPAIDEDEMCQGIKCARE